MADVLAPAAAIDAVRGALASDVGVGLMMIVVVWRARTGFGTCFVAEIGVGVGAFFGEVAVEAFSFPAGLMSLGFGPNMFDAAEGCSEGVGSSGIGSRCRCRSLRR